MNFNVLIVANYHQFINEIDTDRISTILVSLPLNFYKSQMRTEVFLNKFSLMNNYCIFFGYIDVFS